MQNKPVLGSEDRGIFKAILEGAAANPSIGVIANRYPWQTRMAMCKLLDVAKQKLLPVRLLTGSCPESFYDEALASQMRECKKAGSPFIRVLVWQENAEGISPSLSSLAADGTIELRVSGTNMLADKIAHFLLVGDQAFRQEAAHPPFACDLVFTDTAPTVPARIDFDDKETAKTLSEMFDSIWGA
jgi:hypothetical protein